MVPGEQDVDEQTAYGVWFSVFFIPPPQGCVVSLGGTVIYGQYISLDLAEAGVVPPIETGENPKPNSPMDQSQRTITIHEPRFMDAFHLFRCLRSPTTNRPGFF